MLHYLNTGSLSRGALVLLLGTSIITDDVKASGNCDISVYNANLVRALQRKLRETKIPGVQVDGVWDTDTRQAVAAYQKRKRLPANGKLDEQTFRSLFGEQSSFEPIKRVDTHPLDLSGGKEFCD